MGAYHSNNTGIGTSPGPLAGSSAGFGLDACQAQDGIPAPFLEISLLQVLRRKPEQLVLFAFQEPQELQVRFRSPIYDGAWALPEESLARLGAVFEEVQATITLRPSGQLSQALPSDAFDQISSQFPVAKR